MKANVNCFCSNDDLFFNNTVTLKYFSYLLCAMFFVFVFFAFIYFPYMLKKILLIYKV